jgi:hypothetical protein
MSKIDSRLRTGLGPFLACVVLLVGAAVATADTLPPIDVGPITIGDGAAGGSAGSAPANLTVTVDGRPATVDANGNVSVNVDPAGLSTVTLTVTNTETGRVSTIVIPVSLIGPGGVIPASVFEPLRQAGVDVAVPPGGFTSTGNQPVEVSGSVADRSQLASLTVNGIDALSLLQPNSSFAVPVPGSSDHVVVSATDRQGVTGSTSYTITPVSSATGGSSSTTAVGAASAIGVSITGVRYSTAYVKTRKLLGVTLTVRDKRGLLIHGAKVRIRPVFWQNAFVVSTPAARISDASGRVTFTLRLRASKFSGRRRFFTVETAITPSAQATRTTSVRVPRLSATLRQ